jgi:restriction system protein
MEIPKVYDLCNPMLDALRTLGGSGSVQEISDAVSGQMQLPAYITRELHGPGPTTELEYRLAWARIILKAAELVANPIDGAWILTQQGSSGATVDPGAIRDFYSGERVPQGNETFWDELEDDLWRRFGAEQFLAGYCEADAVYDSLR